MSKVKEMLETPSSTVTFNKPADLFAEMEKLHDSISKRAFEIFKDRGSEFGFDLDDWFKAESELVKFVPTEITNLEDRLVVKLEVPGFKLEELKISAEPRRLIIKGKVEKKEEKKKDENVVYSELSSQEIFHDLALPAEIMVDKAEATLKENTLTITLPKTVKPTNVEVKAG